MFDQRATGRELLDDPDCSHEHARASYHFMRTVNRYFGGVATAKAFIKDNAGPGVTTILDIGSGICDIPLALSRWARQAGIRVRFTCIETSPVAVEIAQKDIAQAGEKAITIIPADVFTFEPTERFDLAMGSLFFHHLGSDEIALLMGRLRSLGCRKVLINDLHRSALCYAGCMIACAATAVPAGIRHDALLSVRRGFKPGELKLMLESLAPARVRVDTGWFCRVRAMVEFCNKGTL